MMPSQEELREHLSYDERTGEFRWKKQTRGRKNCGDVAGTTNRYGYTLIGIGGRRQLMAHRLAWVYCFGSIPDGFEIDHIDGNPANNAIMNLRLATSSQQKQNKRVQSNNRSGMKGAFYHACHKGKKWRSQIKVDGRYKFLGYFHTAQEAHEAYGRAAREHYGEFARVA
jgi:hypothetical protein